jgi:hypothetical protein
MASAVVVLAPPAVSIIVSVTPLWSSNCNLCPIWYPALTVSTLGSLCVRRRRQFETVPCGSVSKRQTRCPSCMAAIARPMASVLLPLPPFCETKAIVCMACLYSACLLREWPHTPHRATAPLR